MELKKEYKREGTFRKADLTKNRWTLDNVYISGKLFTFFVDLKATFDEMDKEVVVMVMRKRGLGQGLIVKTKKT